MLCRFDLCWCCQVTVQVDDDIQRTGTTVGDFTTLSSKVIYVGGMPSLFSQSSVFTGTSNPLMADNFRGCLKQVHVLPRW
jgi:Laminin G domain